MVQSQRQDFNKNRKAFIQNLTVPPQLAVPAPLLVPRTKRLHPRCSCPAARATSWRTSVELTCAMPPGRSSSGSGGGGRGGGGRGRGGRGGGGGRGRGRGRGGRPSGRGTALPLAFTGRPGKSDKGDSNHRRSSGGGSSSTGYEFDVSERIYSIVFSSCQA